MKVFYFLLSYAAGFFIILPIASAIDTAGLVIVPIFNPLKRTVPLLVLIVSALSTYLGVVGYCWLTSISSLHVSCAILAIVVIVEYSNDSVQYRAASVLPVLANYSKPSVRVASAMAQAKRIGHVFGFAIAGLVHLRGSPAF